MPCGAQAEFLRSQLAMLLATQQAQGADSANQQVGAVARSTFLHPAWSMSMLFFLRLLCTPKCVQDR